MQGRRRRSSFSSSSFRAVINVPTYLLARIYLLHLYTHLYIYKSLSLSRIIDLVQWFIKYIRGVSFQNITYLFTYLHIVRGFHIAPPPLLLLRHSFGTMTGIENKTFSNVKYTSRKRSLKHMSTIATMIMTWSVTYYGSGVTAFGNHSSQSTTNTAKTITQRMVQLKNELRLTSVQRHMSSVADPQTRTIKRSSSDHQAVITMTRSQLDSFITRRDMERLEASFGMDSDDILQLSETLKILPPTLNTSTKTTSRTGKIKTTVSESKSLLQDVETMIDSHSSSTNNNNNNNNNNKQSSSRRLSTMPGFRSRQHTKRHQSFRDGIKIAQTSNIYNARKIAKAVNDKSTQRKRKKSNSEAMYLSSASVPDSMIAFTNEIHQESRITPKEEADLGTKTQIAMKLQKIHSELTDRLGREPTDDEWCAATGKINITVLQQAIQEGMEAKDRLVLSNLRMVQGVVNLYIRNGLGSQYNAGDLMQEGTMVGFAISILRR